LVGCRLICNRFSADLLFLLKMKHVPTITTADILHKIENIEKEVMDLKLSILKDLSPSGKKVISLKGILKGVNITEQEIASAKKSLYSSTKI